MSLALLLQNEKEVTVECDPEIIENGILKLCKIDNFVFAILNKKNILHSGTLEEKDGKLILSLTNLDIRVHDIARTPEGKLLYVSEDKKILYKASPSNLAECEEIILQENTTCDKHGFEMYHGKLSIKSVSAGNGGELIVTDDGQLWAVGNHPSLKVKPEDGVKRVKLFKDKRVLSVSCGKDFSIALVCKKFYKTGRNSIIKETNKSCEQFPTNCSRCVSENSLTPLSQISLSDTYPDLHKSANYSSSSSVSKSEPCDDKKDIDGVTSPSTEDDNSTKFGSNGKISNALNNSEIEKDVKQSSETDLVKCAKFSADTISLEGPDKKTPITLKPGLAKRFLTRQLSWVSNYANEETLAEYTEGTTRIVRQNVSSVANLVYEGVRSVGDKMVTLSRHMSGGSDSCNDLEDSFEELSMSETHFGRSVFQINDESPQTPSTGTDKTETDYCFEEEDDRTVTALLEDCLRRGSCCLSTEVFTWENETNYCDDCRPVCIQKLSRLGVRQIDCGERHGLALTLDGRLFVWGDGWLRKKAADGLGEGDGPVQAMERTLREHSDRVWETAAAQNHTLLLTHLGEIFLLKGDTDFVTGTNCLQTPDHFMTESVILVKHIAASGDLSWCTIHERRQPLAMQTLTAEQAAVEESLLVLNALIHPLSRHLSGPLKNGGTNNVRSSKKNCRSICTSHITFYDDLCKRYEDLVYFGALNSESLLKSIIHSDEDVGNVALIQHVDEYVLVFRKYLDALCNVISLGGPAFIAREIQVPDQLCRRFEHRLGCSARKSKRALNEAIIINVLTGPFMRIAVYKCFIIQLQDRFSKMETLENEIKSFLQRLEVVAKKWELLNDEVAKQKQEAEETQLFWENFDKLAVSLRIPTRRLVRDSNSHRISVLHGGRFTSHRIVLFNDVLVHVNSGAFQIHPLNLVWVNTISAASEETENALRVRMPEETIDLVASSAEERTEWLRAFRSTIARCLRKPFEMSNTFPNRKSTYTFTQPGPFKDATFVGNWCNGHVNGKGEMTWPSGLVYRGHFFNDRRDGFGRMEVPDQWKYEGHWKDDQRTGRGVMRYASGDVYSGYFLDGLRHGYGLFEHCSQSSAKASVKASVYVGEWINDENQGYGVRIDQISGEKYLGWWSHNVQNGNGILVTVDGNYYEGYFEQGVLTGHGVVVLNNGVHYEGELRSSSFHGKGTLTLQSGDRIEGSIQGQWNSGIKVAGTLYPTEPGHSIQDSKPSSFGKICIRPDRKWTAIFHQLMTSLGVTCAVADCISNSSDWRDSLSFYSDADLERETQQVWKSIAVALTSAREQNAEFRIAEQLNRIPKFQRAPLDIENYNRIRQYLVEAFRFPAHPLCTLISDLSLAYTTSYGALHPHPILLRHAVDELKSITNRLYGVIRLLFPELPTQSIGLEQSPSEASTDSGSLNSLRSEEETVDAESLLHPLLLPHVYPALFNLYRFYHEDDDGLYMTKIQALDSRFKGIDLFEILGGERKQWPDRQLTESRGGSEDIHPFSRAVENLKRVGSTFSTSQKLAVIKETYRLLTEEVRETNACHVWNTDILLPFITFVVIKARIPHFGAEIHFMEDYMEQRLCTGEIAYLLTTIKCSYTVILKETA